MDNVGGKEVQTMAGGDSDVLNYLIHKSNELCKNAYS